MAKKTESKYLSADFFLDHEPEIISFCPAVDPILGGGIREGTLVTIGGPQGLGKTSYALGVGRNGQKVGRICVYCAIEERLYEGNTSLLKAIEGLNLSDDMFKIIASQKGSILTAEDQLQMMEDALIEFPGCILIADSLSDLSSTDDRTKKYGEGFGCSARKLESDFCKRIAPIIRVNKNIVIGIAHTTQSIGPYTATSDQIAGRTKFKAGLMLRCKKPKKDYEIMSGDQQVGHRISWELIKNSFGGHQPTAISHLRYGIGPDIYADIIGIASDLNIIDSKGAGWFELKSGKKLQGFDNLYNYLRENEKEFETIHSEVKEMIK